LTPNDTYSGRTAPLTSKRRILYIYSTSIDTEYFKRGIYSPFFSLQNAVCFIILTYLVPVLFPFYIQVVLKLKNNSGAKRLIFSVIVRKFFFNALRSRSPVYINILNTDCFRLNPEFTKVGITPHPSNLSHLIINLCYDNFSVLIEE